MSELQRVKVRGEKDDGTKIMKRIFKKSFVDWNVLRIFLLSFNKLKCKINFFFLF